MPVPPCFKFCLQNLAFRHWSNKNDVLSQISNNANNLVLNNLFINLNKRNIMKFVTKNSAHSKLHIGYKERFIEETVNTKFLGLQTDNNINWKNCTEEMIPKLSRACWAVRWMVHISNINTLQLIYHAYFHAIIKC